MEFTIKSYNPKFHQQAVIAIFQSRPDIFPEKEIIQINKDLKNESSPKYCKLVAVNNQTVLGYLGVYFNAKKQWYMDWFTVHSNYQHQGIGKKLLMTIIDFLTKKQASDLFVETCSCEGEKVAREFYKSQGFKVLTTDIDGYAFGHSKITFVLKFKR